MPTRGHPRALARSAPFVLASLTATAAVRAEPDPCSLRATVSPCFDADAAWLSAGPSAFVTLPSPRSVGSGALALLAGAGVAVRPVSLVVPSPHPDGRVVPVLGLTSTLTVAARYGLGRGIDVQAALPLVPYQSGTGAEGVTSQRGETVRPFTLRDPRVGVSTALLGRDVRSSFALATRLDVSLPFGEAGALAGAPGPTIAPAFAAAFDAGRLTLAADLGVRLRRAVSFGSVRQGSELVTSVGASLTLLDKPALAVALEAFLRPPLVSRPVASGDDRSLPAEWLASSIFRVAPDARWSVQAGAGTGLPLSRARPDGEARATLGVTAPRLRALAIFRYALGAR
jgi:OOP family OmpA-OmpF porin